MQVVNGNAMNGAGTRATDPVPHLTDRTAGPATPPDQPACAC
jgi:hypothetical protein